MTALSLTACMLLVALWVRSYRAHGFIGFLCGCLVLFLLADDTLGRLLPFKYSGYDYDEKLDLQRLYRLRLDVLRGLAMIMGGFAGALCAADFQRNRWRLSGRAMHVTTTLLAVALWMIVAAR